MLNFFLAIIVDGYVKVSQALQIQETEEHFVADVMWSLRTAYKSYLLKWPPLRKLALHLEKSEFTQTISYETLQMLPKELAFGIDADTDPAALKTTRDAQRGMNRLRLVLPPSKGNSLAIISFMQHYGAFNCLLVPDAGEALYDQIRKAVSHVACERKENENLVCDGLLPCDGSYFPTGEHSCRIID